MCLLYSTSAKLACAHQYVLINIIQPCQVTAEHRCQPADDPTTPIMMSARPNAFFMMVNIFTPELHELNGHAGRIFDKKEPDIRHRTLDWRDFHP